MKPGTYTVKLNREEFPAAQDTVTITAVKSTAKTIVSTEKQTSAIWRISDFDGQPTFELENGDKIERNYPSVVRMGTWGGAYTARKSSAKEFPVSLFAKQGGCDYYVQPGCKSGKIGSWAPVMLLIVGRIAALVLTQGGLVDPRGVILTALTLDCRRPPRPPGHCYAAAFLAPFLHSLEHSPFNILRSILTYILRSSMWQTETRPYTSYHFP